MMHFSKRKSKLITIILVLVIGVCLRFFVTNFEHNYDFDSYLIVADLVDHGENVYANTHRYNYGPIWFYVLGGLYRLSGRNPLTFRYLVVTLLTLVDVGIFGLLLKYKGLKIAILFFLNPISIIITGNHHQFDNLAVLTAVLAISLYGDAYEDPVNRRKITGLILLGISLTIKHIFFAYPLWLAIKQKRLKAKLIVFIIPVMIFLLSFLPYWGMAQDEIINNVFRYRSFYNALFFNYMIPELIQMLFPTSTIFWFFVLTCYAFICKDIKNLDSLLIYTWIMTCTAPATNSQYLAITAAYTAVWCNPLSILSTLNTTISLMFLDQYGLKLPSSLQKILPSSITINDIYLISIILLFLSYYYKVIRNRTQRLARWIHTEVKQQLK